MTVRAHRVALILKTSLRFLACWFALALTVALPAQSYSPRIAVIDVQAVLTTSPAGKAATDKLTQLEAATRTTGAAEE